MNIGLKKNMARKKPDDRPLVTVIGGPTASGKSRAALRLAEAHDGVVINADAMQVYRDLAILTARPGPDALARAPHALYGVLDAAERGSAASWRDRAARAIDSALADGRAPIVVGGTGLYLRALMHGLAPVPRVPGEVTRAVAARRGKLGPAAFHAKLARADPEMAARLAPGDSQRCIRALAVIEATGKSLAHWQRRPAGSVAYRFRATVILPDRATLYAACDARLEAMIEAGALGEVRALMARRLDANLPAMKSLGVRELAAVNDGTLTLAAAVAAAQAATRRYAKRQTTWFRHQMDEAKQVLNYEELAI